jgi:molecular chaperone GrpE
MDDPKQPIVGRSELEKLRLERDSLYDRLLRQEAELQNFKKAVRRDKANWESSVPHELMDELAAVLDSLEEALRNAASEEEPNEGMLDGFELIYKKFLDDLVGAGLQPIDATGQHFDPRVHKAVATLPTTDVEENMVIQEMSKGYLLDGRLLRPAMVVVSVRGDRSDADSD